MAGHSQFRNIMHRKGAQDARRARIFTRLTREITVAARAGVPDPAANPRLRTAIAAARAANMPKDRVGRAISQAAGSDENYEEIRYEGYGAGGVAVIVEVLTGNRRRTVPEIRAAFSKYGGSLGETNSVAFLFDRVGEIRLDGDNISGDDIISAALEAGADDCTTDSDGSHCVITSMADFPTVLDSLTASCGEPLGAGLVWRPRSRVDVTDPENARLLLRMLAVLEENDDVQGVYSNFEMEDALIGQVDP